jgi:hypothetical protein
MTELSSSTNRRLRLIAAIAKSRDGGFRPDIRQNRDSQ